MAARSFLSVWTFHDSDGIYATTAKLALELFFRNIPPRGPASAASLPTHPDGNASCEEMRRLRNNRDFTEEKRMRQLNEL